MSPLQHHSRSYLNEVNRNRRDTFESWLNQRNRWKFPTHAGVYSLNMHLAIYKSRNVVPRFSGVEFRVWKISLCHAKDFYGRQRWLDCDSTSNIAGKCKQHKQQRKTHFRSEKSKTRAPLYSSKVLSKLKQEEEEKSLIKSSDSKMESHSCLH